MEFKQHFFFFGHAESVFLSLTDEPNAPNFDFYDLIWKTQIPSKVQVLLVLFLDKLNTHDLMQRKPVLSISMQIKR